MHYILRLVPFLAQKRVFFRIWEKFPQKIFCQPLDKKFQNFTQFSTFFEKFFADAILPKSVKKSAKIAENSAFREKFSSASHVPSPFKESATNFVTKTHCDGSSKWGSKIIFQT